MFKIHNDEDDFYHNKYYDKNEIEEFLKKYLKNHESKPKNFDDATINDFIEKFGIEKILEKIGEDKIQDFIRRKKIQKLKQNKK